MDRGSIKIFTIGTLRIEKDNREVREFRTRKSELLFTYLALHPGQHSRDLLGNLFWSDQLQELMLNNLSKTLNNLKQLFPDALLADRHTLTFNPELPLWIDSKLLETELN